MYQPTTVQALNGSNVPVTGLSPTWLFYGSVSGTNYASTRRPDWREIGLGVYGFMPYAADKANGAVWVADFGASVARRYQCGVVGTAHKAFLSIAGGVPAGTVTPTISTYFMDQTAADPAASVVNLSASQAGLFLQPEPVIGIGATQRRPWTQKGAVSVVDFGGGTDALYRYQSAWWGYGTVEAVDMSQFNILSPWPSELPQEPFGEASATYTPRDNTIRTENETGPAQVRRRYTSKTEVFSFSLVLNPTQMAVLEYFYRTTLQETRKFTWTDFRTLQPANYRFMGPYTCEYWASEETPLGHWWKVQIQLELL